MAANINLVLDASGSGLLQGGGSTLIRGDTYNFRLRIMENNLGVFSDTVLSSPYFSMAFGREESIPNSGFFKLTTSTGSSQPIAYNASTTDFLSAISAVAGNVTVTTHGNQESAWLISAATANVALNLTGVTFSLFPSTTIQINTLVPHASGVTAVKSVQLMRLPALSATSFSSASTANVVTMVKLQTGSATGNTIYQLSIGADAVGGSFAVIYGSNSTAAVSLGATSLILQTALSSVTGLGSDISVVSAAGNTGHIISFTGSKALTNVTTPLLLDLAGVQYAKWYETSITFSGNDLEEMFFDSQANSCTGLLEVEMTEQGMKKTLLQAEATVKKDIQL